MNRAARDHRMWAAPRMCGVDGWVKRFSGNRRRRQVVISKPAAVIEAAGSLAVRQPPASSGHTVASAIRCTDAVVGQRQPVGGPGPHRHRYRRGLGRLSGQCAQVRFGLDGNHAGDRRWVAREVLAVPGPHLDDVARQTGEQLAAQRRHALVFHPFAHPSVEAAEHPPGTIHRLRSRFRWHGKKILSVRPGLESLWLRGPTCDEHRIGNLVHNSQ